MIEVKVYEPGKPGVILPIENTLEAMQAIVGGYIEIVKVYAFIGRYMVGLIVVCNEDGLDLNLPDNRAGFVGTFFVARQQSGELVSLTEDDKLALAGGEWA